LILELVRNFNKNIQIMGLYYIYHLKFYYLGIN